MTIIMVIGEVLVELGLIGAVCEGLEMALVFSLVIGFLMAGLLWLKGVSKGERVMAKEIKKYNNVGYTQRRKSFTY